MADDDKHKAFDLGFFAPPGGMQGIDPADVVALFLSVVWLAVAAAVLFMLDFGAADAGLGRLGFLLVLLAVIVPLALIWLAASAAKAVRLLREEARLLRAAMDGMRQSYLETKQAGGAAHPSVVKRRDEMARAQRRAEDAIATFASRRARNDPPKAEPTPAAAAQSTAPAPGDQPSLALGPAPESMTPPLAVDEFIRALEFPESLDDREGFRALRRALEDRRASKLVRAAQDVLELLSQDGIYMDDVTPDRARPEIWRRFFGEGERGPALAALGGVRDKAWLDSTAARMKQDPVFRDVAHHFLRQFDTAVTEFLETASDQQVSDLAETRTARAFMLLGRVTGMFG